MSGEKSGYVALPKGQQEGRIGESAPNAAPSGFFSKGGSSDGQSGAGGGGGHGRFVEESDFLGGSNEGYVGRNAAPTKAGYATPPQAPAGGTSNQRKNQSLYLGPK